MVSSNEVVRESRAKAVSSFLLAFAALVTCVSLALGWESYKRHKDILNGIQIQGIVDNVYMGLSTDESKDLTYYSVRVYDSHGDIDHVEMDSSSFLSSYSKGDHVDLVIRRSDVNYIVSKDSVDGLKRGYRFLFLSGGIGVFACSLSFSLIVVLWSRMTTKGSEPAKVMRRISYDERDYNEPRQGETKRVEQYYTERPNARRNPMVSEPRYNTTRRNDGFSRQNIDYSSQDLSRAIGRAMINRERPMQEPQARKVKVTVKPRSSEENSDDFDLFDM